MKETKIPGVKAHHSIISDECRTGRTNDGAFIEAVKRMKEVYDRTCEGYKVGMGCKINIVMTIERR